LEEFEAKQHEHEKYHFLDFMAFIMTKKFKGTPLINFISENENKQWQLQLGELCMGIQWQWI
jgi:hypothetical protein